MRPRKRNRWRELHYRITAGYRRAATAFGGYRRNIAGNHMRFRNRQRWHLNGRPHSFRGTQPQKEMPIRASAYFAHVFCWSNSRAVPIDKFVGSRTFDECNWPAQAPANMDSLSRLRRVAEFYQEINNIVESNRRKRSLDRADFRLTIWLCLFDRFGVTNERPPHCDTTCVTS